jgi:hypothetical protein
VGSVLDTKVMTPSTDKETTLQNPAPLDSKDLESLPVELDSKLHRTHWFVDPNLQLSLILRFFFYWSVCVLTLGVSLLCWRVVTGPTQSFQIHWENFCFYEGPAFLLAIIFLPLIVSDMLHFSNRFVGPMLRLRRSLRQLARGEHVDSVEFRHNDFWQELAEEFDAVLARVESLSNSKNAEDAKNAQNHDSHQEHDDNDCVCCAATQSSEGSPDAPCSVPH